MKQNDMDFCFVTFAALFSFFAAACCVPHGHTLQDACADVRSSSLELNRIARTASIEARNGSNDLMDFSTSLAWMEAKDMCDPETLNQKPVTCLEKMLSVLASYDSSVERVTGFQSCSVARTVKPAIHKLQEDMRKCVKSKAGMNHQKESHIQEETQPIAGWQEALLCHYTMDRLFSFSILTARVFAVGDPAHHTEGVTQKCM